MSPPKKISPFSFLTNKVELPGFTELDVLDFTGRAYAKPTSSTWRYYPRVFGKLAAGDLYTWNWATFFLGWHWLVFRKMYLYAAIIAVLTFLFPILPVSLSTAALLKPSLLLTTLFSRCLLALAFNMAYFRKFTKYQKARRDAGEASPADTVPEPGKPVNLILAATTFTVFEILLPILLLAHACL